MMTSETGRPITDREQGIVKGVQSLTDKVVLQSFEIEQICAGDMGDMFVYRPLIDIHYLYIFLCSIFCQEMTFKFGDLIKTARRMSGTFHLTIPHRQLPLRVRQLPTRQFPTDNCFSDDFSSEESQVFCFIRFGGGMPKVRKLHKLHQHQKHLPQTPQTP
jgi:hypothetical protein